MRIWIIHNELFFTRGVMYTWEHACSCVVESDIAMCCDAPLHIHEQWKCEITIGLDLLRELSLSVIF